MLVETTVGQLEMVMKSGQAWCL